MAQLFRLKTQVLLDAADRAIARSRELVDQRRKIMAECERDGRFAVLREIRKPE
jgi:hypothetical protein